MWILLFLISAIFSFIFYFFFDLSTARTLISDNRFISQYFQSISWNLLIETLTFLLIGVVFLFLFSTLFESKEKWESIPYVKNFFKDNFKTILYYVWFIFFYISLYLILKDLSFDFSYIILTVNILILTWFFLTKKFFIVWDLLKINTIIFSSIYIFLYLLIFITHSNNFIFIDFLNSLLIFTSFFVVLYNEKVLLKKNSDSWFIMHLFIYIFLFISYYFSQVFDSLSFIFCVLAFLLNFYIFFFLKKIKFFKSSLLTLKIIWVFLSYISIMAWIYYLLTSSFNILIVAIIAYLSFLNFKVHKLYENYISFSFFAAGFYFLLFYLYYNIIYLVNFNDIYFSTYAFIICFSSVLSTYIYKFEWIYDYYFMYIVSGIVNILATIFFFYTNSFDLLNLWIILLLDSIIIFLSYNKLKQIE